MTKLNVTPQKLLDRSANMTPTATEGAIELMHAQYVIV